MYLSREYFAVHSCGCSDIFLESYTSRERKRCLSAMIVVCDLLLLFQKSRHVMAVLGKCINSEVSFNCAFVHNGFKLEKNTWRSAGLGSLKLVRQ